MLRRLMRLTRDADGKEMGVLDCTTPRLLKETSTGSGNTFIKKQ